MDELDELGRRIERIALHPDTVRAPWTRLVRPILRTIGWRPAFRTKALRLLIDELARATQRRTGDAAGEPAAVAMRRVAELSAEATGELESNVVAAERACVVDGGLPVAYVAWLRRLFEVVVRAVRASRVEAPKLGALRMAACVDPVLLLPPLAIAAAGDTGSADGAVGGEGDAAAKADQERPAADTPAGEQTDPVASRLVELQLAAIDHLIDAAREEPDFMARRRRLLEAARSMLLDTSAALPLEKSGVEARRRYLAEQIVRVDRLQAAGVSPDVSLAHQARAAVADGDRRRLHATLVAMDGLALGVGDGALAARTGEALARLREGMSLDPEALRRDSLVQSHGDVLGPTVVNRVQRAYRDARNAVRPGTTPEEREISEIARQYLAPGAELATLPLVLASDGCFEVGGTLSPVRVTEHHVRTRTVGFPTQDMILLPARDPSDIPSALIDDPRMVLTALAEGRLLTRKYVQYERVPRNRTQLVGEVRVYVLDGSGSMVESGSNGARARMRDAILLAELATLMQRFEDSARRVRVVLYYRYFSHELGPVVRVDSGPAALAAIGDVLGQMRVGGTDIERALVASLQQVQQARQSDPDLARAQIVLVTDGEAEVREDVVLAARAAMEDLPIHVSVIALGQENPALARLVARQRARGERAFYHFLSDEALAAMLSRGVDPGEAIHLPPVPEDASTPPAQRAAELDALLGGLLDELATLGRERHVESLEQSSLEHDALTDLGVTAAARTEGERARGEAHGRDRRALEARFARWFPRADAAPATASNRSGDAALEPGDAEAALVVLSAVAEVVGEMGGTELSRRADAIDLVERLLPDARLSPARYQAVVAAAPAPVARALAAVHAAVTPARLE
jgi:hypothetical protein